jgi:hypothetical protein
LLFDEVFTYIKCYSSRLIWWDLNHPFLSQPVCFLIARYPLMPGDLLYNQPPFQEMPKIISLGTGARCSQIFISRYVPRLRSEATTPTLNAASWCGD